MVNTATVKATNVDTGFTRSAPANGYGEYRIDYLPVGKYTVEAKAAGFERFVQKNLALDVDQTLTLEHHSWRWARRLRPSRSPRLPRRSIRRDAVLGRTIEPAEVIGLPLVNRNAYTELSLTPGIMANSSSVTQNPAGTPNFTVGLPSEDVQVNGSLDSGNGTVAFYLDGGNNITGMRNYGNPAPNPDAIEEIRVDTNAFAAEYGQFSGAVVSVITKSGTNQAPRQFVRVQPQYRLQCIYVEYPRTYLQGPLPPQQLWRNRRRPHQARQVLLLLQLCRSAPDTRRDRSQALRCPRLRAPGRLYRGHDPDHPLFTSPAPSM